MQKGIADDWPFRSSYNSGMKELPPDLKWPARHTQYIENIVIAQAQPYAEDFIGQIGEAGDGWDENDECEFDAEDLEKLAQVGKFTGAVKTYIDWILENHRGNEGDTLFYVFSFE